MKKYTSVDDIIDLPELLDLAASFKKEPFQSEQLGKRKTIGLLFFNPSLRTRLSTQKAASNLGMEAMVMNLNSEGWLLEFEDGVVMDGTKAEHIREAAAVVSQYCDILAVRSFPTLTDKEKDMQEYVISAFVKFASVPVISLEGSSEHPLQALADALTIAQFKKTDRPKVVLTWAPHPKALPHAVPNSFVKIMKRSDVDFVIANPEGYNLDPSVTEGVEILHNQKEAFANADFIYAKNWSSFETYGQVLSTDESWTVSEKRMRLTNDAYFMHCLPVRRNMIVTDAVLDSDRSIVIEQANNRTFAAQAILSKMLQHE
ncbi:N-acetylornithine carbamoyltransferase [Flavobacterium silvaticum]|uniref:N-succinylornithine carbamoyltransferase n=1 Tax=Flavobacterium silvaticum TaxID=1852020 RepID=A0A972FL14_9FLAO|nr:N-acetylornithine carbamoyltransferase [Flavobacterium silvaticum]NMH27190.1 N-acetylornithine carbamoyltransferase [Flavobacterium silvaticum]